MYGKGKETKTPLLYRVRPRLKQKYMASQKDGDSGTMGSCMGRNPCLSLGDAGKSKGGRRNSVGEGDTDPLEFRDAG